MKVLFVCDASFLPVRITGFSFHHFNHIISRFENIEYIVEYYRCIETGTLENPLQWADVVILFGLAGEIMHGNDELTVPPFALCPRDLKALISFMERGGGVLATGDHETLGASLCAPLPRIRHMRKWLKEDMVPSQIHADRLTTISPDENGKYDFDNQSLDLPQHVKINLESKIAKTILGEQEQTILPAHPHEGECVIPTDEQLQLDEWKGCQKPEVLCWGTSQGKGFKFGKHKKASVKKREFISMVAFDHESKGRIITHSTFHHFMDTNTVGITNDPLHSGLSQKNLDIIHQQWHNELKWLAREI